MRLVAAEKRCANERYSGGVGTQRLQYHGKYLCPPGYNIQEHIGNENDQRGQHQSQYLRERVRENTERTGQNTLHFRR